MKVGEVRSVSLLIESVARLRNVRRPIQGLTREARRELGSVKPLAERSKMEMSPKVPMKH